MTSVSSIWLILLIIIAGGLAFGKLTERAGVPDVAGYLLFGILVGPVLGWIHEPPTAVLPSFILTAGATVILFEGGRGIRLDILRSVWLSVTLLSTLGVLVSTAVTGWAIHLWIGIPWLASFLAAAVIASTDPATLIPVFRRVPVEDRLQQAVESESAFNDATGSILTFTLLAVALGGGGIPLWQPALDFAQSAGFGLAMGAAVGLLCCGFVSARTGGFLTEFAAVVMLGGMLLAYQTAYWLGGSGFMAAFVAGIVVGNAHTFKMPFSRDTKVHIEHVMGALTLLVRMLIFTLLGEQIHFRAVAHYLWPGLAVIAVFILIARPVSVLCSTLVDRIAKWRWAELLFMFWTRETGVIPAALSVLLVSKGAPHADVISAITFLAIVATVFLQATTTGVVARRLGVAKARPSPRRT